MLDLCVEHCVFDVCAVCLMCVFDACVVCVVCLMYVLCV